MSKKLPNWLETAVFYQIYPQSFCDSNFDGIGDLNGIKNKLDYISSLGCNAIWLNPINDSPFLDAGYDITDYYKVAPRYGTNADVKSLCKAAHKKGIKVCLDLVPGHTSIQHPWFTKSCEHTKNEFTNRYAWTDNPWEKTNHGLRLIHGFGERHGNFVANFFWNQPALNYGFANPDPDKKWQLPVTHRDIKATVKEIENIIRFWLDMGVDGFRVDMAQSLVKNDPEWKETSKIWQRIRTMMDKNYDDRILISEWSKPTAAINAGFHIDFLLAIYDNAYSSLLRQETKRDIFGRREGNSFFDKKGLGNITEFLDIFTKEYKATLGKGYVSIPTGNHDISRLAFNRSKKELEIIFAFVLTMPGIPFIYYGDELGMKYIQGMPSKEGGYGRTGSRTPMQWSTKKNSGFSDAKPSELYLPLQDSTGKLNVEAQEESKKSMLNIVRNFIDMRRSSAALSANGTYETLYAQAGKYPFIYKRTSKDENYIIIVNPAGRTEKADFKDDLSGYQLIAGSSPDVQKKAGKSYVTVKPVSYSIFKKTN